MKTKNENINQTHPKLSVLLFLSLSFKVHHVFSSLATRQRSYQSSTLIP